MNEEEKKIKARYLTSLAMALPVDGEVKHVQITIAQEEETKAMRCFFDVVDPTKVKLAEE